MIKLFIEVSNNVPIWYHTGSIIIAISFFYEKSKYINVIEMIGFFLQTFGFLGMAMYAYTKSSFLAIMLVSFGIISLLLAIHSFVKNRR